MRRSDLLLRDTRETAAAERLAMTNGVSGFALMERAGRAVADRCVAGYGQGAAAVLCGPGNNGGDGFVVARHLLAAGWKVTVFALDAASVWPGDAAQARQRWPGAISPAASFDPASFDIVIDSLLGAGLSRPVEGAAAALIAAVNAGTRPVIAVDVPSGVDATTGAVRGVALKAAETVTFGTAKPGHYLYPGRSYRGRLTVVDIGLDESAPPLGTFINAPPLWLPRFPWPESNGHKYRRGHAVVVSGNLSQTGAARLAARSALRVGAGLVTLASPTDALAVNAAHLTAIMLRASDGAAGLRAILDDARKCTVVLGPGLGVGAATCALVEIALSPQPERREDVRPRACLLDADALTSFAGEADRLRGLIATAPGPVVITPHDGEFARLFSAQALSQDGGKVGRVREAARFLGCTVLLKGADTVVADSDGRASISDGGAPWLATAGSGDVLSGIIGGLLTQGMPPFEAAAAGDHLHTASAKIFGPGLIAEDLPEMLPRALEALYHQGLATREAP